MKSGCALRAQGKLGLGGRSLLLTILGRCCACESSRIGPIEIIGRGEEDELFGARENAI